MVGISSLFNSAFFRYSFPFARHTPQPNGGPKPTNNTCDNHFSPQRKWGWRGDLVRKRKNSQIQIMSVVQPETILANECPEEDTSAAKISLFARCHEYRKMKSEKKMPRNESDYQANFPFFVSQWKWRSECCLLIRILPPNERAIL